MVQKRGSWESLAAGAVAGGIDACITMPLDTMKTQMQLRSYPSVVACGKTIYNTSGVSGLYSGFRPFLVQATGKAAVRFASYATLCNAVDSAGIDRHKNPTLWSLACGLGAGCIEALGWTTPSERLKVMQQSEAATVGGHTTLRGIIGQYGVRGLYVGALPTAMRQSSSVAIRFTMYERIKHACNTAFTNAEGKATLPAPAVAFIGGGLGGALSVMINNPIDVMKSRIQAGFQGGVVACAMDTLKTRGPTAFAAGLSARVPRLFLSQAIQFTVVDQIIELLRHLHA